MIGICVLLGSNSELEYYYLFWEKNGLNMEIREFLHGRRIRNDIKKDEWCVIKLEHCYIINIIFLTNGMRDEIINK